MYYRSIKVLSINC